MEVKNLEARLLITASGYSQRKIAAQLGVHYQTLTRWLCGKFGSITPERLEAIKKAIKELEDAEKPGESGQTQPGGNTIT